jgi:hypothetical protein
MERLRHEGEGVLLIFDNAFDADALKPYLPRGGAAKVLVTSNAHAWRGVAAPVEIQVWPTEIGADYLIARTGRAAERAAGEALSKVLGGLPLAHEQAAAYCERLDISLADYRKRFEAAPARLLDDTRHAPAEYQDGLTSSRGQDTVAWRILSRYRSSQLIIRIETPATLSTTVLSMSSPEPGNSTATGRSSLVQCRPLLRRPTDARAFRSSGDGRGQRSRSVGWYSPPAQYSSAVPPTTIGLLLSNTVMAAARRRR